MNDAQIDFMRKWLRDFGLKADRTNDYERAELLDLFNQMATLPKTNSDQQRFDLSEEGRHKARQLNEPWFELLFIHGKMMARRGLQDFHGALDEAMRATVIASSEPDYVLSGCTFHDLIAVYQVVDPFVPKIRPALQQMEETIPSDSNCQMCINGCSVKERMLVGKPEEAKSLVLKRLAKCDEEDDKREREEDQLSCYLSLAQIASRQKKWKELNKWTAAIGKVVNSGLPLQRAEAFLWKAIDFRVRRHEKSAGSAYQSAIKKLERVSELPSSRLFEAKARFHEIAEDFAAALRVRDDQYEQIKDRGMTGVECFVLVQICWLKKQLAQNFQKELKTAEALASGLSHPKQFFKLLGEVPSSHVPS